MVAVREVAEVAMAQKVAVAPVLDKLWECTGLLSSSMHGLVAQSVRAKSPLFF